MPECDLYAQQLFCSGIRDLNIIDIYIREHMFCHYPPWSLHNLITWDMLIFSCIANIGQYCALEINF